MRLFSYVQNFSIFFLLNKTSRRKIESEETKMYEYEERFVFSAAERRSQMH